MTIQNPKTGLLFCVLFLLLTRSDSVLVALDNTEILVHGLVEVPEPLIYYEMKGTENP